MPKIATFLSMLFAVVALMVLPYDAEAKRLGGGGSIGKQYSTPATPPASSTAPRMQQNSAGAAPAGQRPSGASRWLGPLAGLAAGGLIASMLFGDGFEGFQFMDFLVIAGLIFGGMMLFRAMRNRASPVPQPAGVPHGTIGDHEPEAPRAGSAPAVMAAAGGFDAPAWFDRAGFVEGAKGHFIRLQQAWNRGDMREISEYTTLDLFAQLEAERARGGAEHEYTEVVSLDAELAGVQRDGGQMVASVRFSGLIREERDGEAAPFAEIWHVRHAWDSREGDWTIAGITQA